MAKGFFKFEKEHTELAKLLNRVERKGLKALNDRELRRFCLLYRAAATQLARARSFSASARKTEYLNDLVTRAHTFLYTPKGKSGLWKTVLLTPFFIPQAIRSALGYHAASCLLLLAGWSYGFLGAGSDPEWGLNFLMPGDTRTFLAEKEELRASLQLGRAEGAEISGAQKTTFAALLWRHNTRIAITVFFGGLLAGVPTVLMLLYNGAVLGVYSSVFHSHGLAFEWWAWLLPHAITELLGVVLLGGGGLLLGKTLLVSQNSLSRVQAFRKIRGQLVYTLLLAFPIFFLAAIIESFVRQSQLSDPGRYIFAAATAFVWFLYLGLVRLPESQRKRLEHRTKAESATVLPHEDDLLQVFGNSK